MGAWIIPLAVFLGVSAFVMAVMLVYQDRRANQLLQSRLEAFAGSKPTEESSIKLLKEPAESEEPQKGLIPRLTLFSRARALIDQADLNIGIETIVLITCALAVLGCVAAVVLGLPGPLVPAGSVLGLGPWVFLWWRRRQRLKKFAEQLPDALELIARALRAGHSLSAGMQLVSHEMPPPIGVEFRRAYEEQNLGIPLEEALENLGDRVPNVDLGFFITAVLIQRQTGGDLAEVLDKIGYIIRERFKIFGQVAALTAEGRLSGWILMALPFAVFLGLLKLNYGYVMMLFSDPLGLKMVYTALALQIIGALVIQKIVRIHV